MPALYSKDDEEKAPDFRSRYAAETAGMPANLAAIASKNLAAQDASLDKINAVQRYNSALPGVGTPGSTPQTDAANLSMANAMDRADLGNRFGFDSPQYTQGTDTPTIADLHTDDIAQRRAAIDEQRKQIQARLGIIQPREAGLAAVVLAGPKEKKDLLANWQMLEHEDSRLLQEHHYNAIDAAKTAHENFAKQAHITAANDFASLASELADLHKNTKPGSPEFASGVLDIAQRHPAGFQTQAGQTLFRGITGLHDKAAELEDRSYWQRFGQAFKEASQVARKRGVDVQYDDQGFPSTGLTAQAETTSAGDVPAAAQTRYAKLAATIQKHQEESAAEEAQNRASKQANVPYSKAADFHAAQTELSLLQKQFPGLADATDTAPAPSPAPSGTPDLKALAEKALADPNASEEHKKAARKLLGQ